VNTRTTDDQALPSITSLGNGGFVVVWHSLGQDGSWYGVYGQMFDSNGSKVGSEFQVNTWTTNDQWVPSITSLSNGGFVVVWSSYGQDGSSYGVYGQRFESSGRKVGSEFQVNTWNTDFQGAPSITSLSNGGFVVVWTGVGQNDSAGVYGQRFDSNGNKVGSEFQVNRWTTDNQALASITSLSNGGFVVVWVSGCDPHLGVPCTATPQDGSYYGVYGQRFDSNGNKVGSEFQVNTRTTDYQWDPSIASRPNGGFVVVWGSGCDPAFKLPCTATPEDGSGWGVYGRIFSQ
jgi:methionine-rich copper-binding protein CopC